jgi:small-conductance mechanosensitive channel
MITKDTLTAEVKELRDQYTKAQQQYFAAKQQTEDLSATVDRLQGAIIVTEKYLGLFENQGQVQGQAPQTGAQTGVPNGMQPIPAAVVS